MPPTPWTAKASSLPSDRIPSKSRHQFAPTKLQSSASSSNVKPAKSKALHELESLLVAVQNEPSSRILDPKGGCFCQGAFILSDDDRLRSTWMTNLLSPHAPALYLRPDVSRLRPPALQSQPPYQRLSTLHVIPLPIPVSSRQSRSPYPRSNSRHFLPRRSRTNTGGRGRTKNSRSVPRSPFFSKLTASSHTPSHLCSATRTTQSAFPQLQDETCRADNHHHAPVSSGFDDPVPSCFPACCEDTPSAGGRRAFRKSDCAA